MTKIISYLNSIGSVGYVTVFVAILAYIISFYKLIIVLIDNIKDTLYKKFNLFSSHAPYSIFIKNMNKKQILILSQKYFNYFNISRQIAKILPIFGIIGTINGMITLFLAINDNGNIDATILSKGISQALLSTQLALSLTAPLIIINAIIESLGNSKISEFEIKISEKE